MATVAEDDLTDLVSQDTDITNRNLFPGPGQWVMLSTNLINALVGPPPYFIGQINGTATARTGVTSPSLNDEIEATYFISNSNNNNSGVVLGASGTIGGADRAWYAFYVSNTSPYNYILNKFDEAGAIDAELANVTQASTVGVTTNVDYQMKLKRVDNGNGTVQLIGTIDGTQIFSVTDNSPLGIGQGGMRLRNGARIYNLLHTTSAAVAASSFSSSRMLLGVG